MIPKIAIEKAQSIGWKPRCQKIHMHRNQCVFALDPTFWQALGKALGWKAEVCFICGEKLPCWCDRSDIAYDGDEKIPEWKFHAHRFYDKVLQSEDTSNFWEELLK